MSAAAGETPRPRHTTLVGKIASYVRSTVAEGGVKTSIPTSIVTWRAICRYLADRIEHDFPTDVRSNFEHTLRRLHEEIVRTTGRDYAVFYMHDPSAPAERGWQAWFGVSASSAFFAGEGHTGEGAMLALLDKMAAAPTVAPC